MKQFGSIVVVFLSPLIVAGAALADTFTSEVLPILEQHCTKCHGGEKTRGEVDLSAFHSYADAENSPELWEAILFVVEDGEMPPEDEPPMSESDRNILLNWLENDFFGEIESKPAPFKPRRLSGPEYRNTMRSLFGFDLEVNVAEAEQTVVEKSLVLKLLPTDPPGASGYINDTHSASLSTTIWNQYAYLADVALEQFFSSKENITLPEAGILVREFVPRAFRRPVPEQRISEILENLHGKVGNELVAALKGELKVLLMSPAFLYRGHLAVPTTDLSRQKVDNYELAERLSYFIHEDMPDAELCRAAATGNLHDPKILRAQVDRLLGSRKSRTLATSFASQWLLLDQIHHERNDPPYLHALQNQPLEFIHWLITENRPLMELIDSDVTFFNANIANYYGSDRKFLEKFNKPRGVERMIMPLQKVSLRESLEDRGAGILTMPGVLGMNEGPILRGTWMLRQILGEHLGEPPPDVPPIQSGPKSANLTFREKFEAHRADKSCALCHDKIDPLGFALESYDKHGGVIGQNQSRKKEPEIDPQTIDTSGQLPGGQTFSSFQELHGILLSTEKERIIRNAVEQMLAYALCRKLERYDRPTVDALTQEILRTDGTWRDLIHGIAQSVPFTETVYSTATKEP